VQAFYRAADAAGPVSRSHLDMHTAIRGSLYRQFALLPAHEEDFSPGFYQLLQASGMDAIVRHTEAGGTFTHFTCEKFAAQSATLELGKVMPFGANDLSLFAADAAIRAWISDAPLPRAIKRRWITSWSRRASSSARGIYAQSGGQR
jgi:succinylglutamate desuccinylase